MCCPWWLFLSFPLFAISMHMNSFKWKYAHLALTTITQLYLTCVTFHKYYQFIYIINIVFSSLSKCYCCTYITYWMFLNKDIHNHKQNFLNCFEFYSEEKFHFIEMMYVVNTLTWVFTVLALWNDSPLGRCVSPRRYGHAI
jgi:glucan phosphoethanolaminetransferase (alkaline phosphatase superfamily)